jgi:hypothetical protein
MPTRFETIKNRVGFVFITNFRKRFISIAPNVYHVSGTMGGGAPAYSMAGRAKEGQPAAATLPGPGAYEEAKADAIKKRPPAYTMAARQKRVDNTPAPGPGNYSPEKVDVDLLREIIFILQSSLTNILLTFFAC